MVILRVPVAEDDPDLLFVDEPLVVKLEVPVLEFVADLDWVDDDVSLRLCRDVLEGLIVAHIEKVERPEDVSLLLSMGLLL